MRHDQNPHVGSAASSGRRLILLFVRVGQKPLKKISNQPDTYIPVRTSRGRTQFLVQRQFEGEGRASSGFRGDADLAGVEREDASDDGEAEPGLTRGC
jgi:hypothetical protein